MTVRGSIGLAFAVCAACTGGTPYATQDTKTTPAPVEAAAGSAARSTDAIRRDGNHLKGEPSPYLEQHAHNPVDWYPWGDAALQKAKDENKPIFLSIGYSTCHWCHVMEKESFEDDEVAAFLNEHFVSIKVDREQRPDVDAVYIDAVRALGGSTGWPLTVFLTPSLEPFFGGTYYPRHGRGGRPGFMDVLKQVRQSFATEGDEVALRGQDVLRKIERQALAAVKQPGRMEAALLDKAMIELARSRDPVHGGFGSRQKFPNAPLLLAELRYVKRSGHEATKTHLLLTLDEILAGGIRDHIAGTFHRYAVDKEWHIPHFEKTLYDNAQLAGLYVEAGLFFGRDDYVAAGRSALDHMILKWRGAGRGFIVGFDADDPEGEGAYYSWTPAELKKVLGKADAEVVAAAFGVDAAGDREIEGRSVLHREDDAATAKKLGITVEALDKTIREALPRLGAVRKQRPPPGKDEKVLVGWNGLAVMALADTSRWLNHSAYLAAAEATANFVLEKCWDGDRMLRGFRGQNSLGDGFLVDYALTGLALLRLHAASGSTHWLQAAREIATKIIEHYYDKDEVAFMRTRAGSSELPVRMADMDDGVLPSGGAAAALLALELGAMAGDEELYAIGERVLRRASGFAQNGPRSAGYLLVAADHYLAPVREVVIASDPGDSAGDALWSEVAKTTHARILPIRIPAAGAGTLVKDLPALAGKKSLRGKPTAFVCERGSCQTPTSDPKTLRAQLRPLLRPHP